MKNTLFTFSKPLGLPPKQTHSPLPGVDHTDHGVRPLAPEVKHQRRQEASDQGQRKKLVKQHGEHKEISRLQFARVAMSSLHGE